MRSATGLNRSLYGATTMRGSGSAIGLVGGAMCMHGGAMSSVDKNLIEKARELGEKFRLYRNIKANMRGGMYGGENESDDDENNYDDEDNYVGPTEKQKRAKREKGTIAKFNFYDYKDNSKYLKENVNYYKVVIKYGGSTYRAKVPFGEIYKPVKVYGVDSSFEKINEPWASDDSLTNAEKKERHMDYIERQIMEELGDDYVAPKKKKERKTDMKLSKKQIQKNIDKKIKQYGSAVGQIRSMELYGIIKTKKQQKAVSREHIIEVIDLAEQAENRIRDIYADSIEAGDIELARVIKIYNDTIDEKEGKKVPDPDIRAVVPEEPDIRRPAVHEEPEAPNIFIDENPKYEKDEPAPVTDKKQMIAMKRKEAKAKAEVEAKAKAEKKAEKKVEKLENKIEELKEVIVELKEDKKEMAGSPSKKIKCRICGVVFDNYHLMSPVHLEALAKRKAERLRLKEEDKKNNPEKYERITRERKQKANAWITHLKAYREANPDVSYKVAMQRAKATYNR